MPDPTVALYTLASPLHPAAGLEQSHRGFLESLGAGIRLLSAPPGQAIDADLHLIFIASGGVEGIFRRLREQLPRPALLLADGKHNSLAAALEIMSWLRRRGERPELLHGEAPALAERLKQLIGFEATRRALGGRIGIIGPPSDWLIGSEVDYPAAARRWGTEFHPVELEELVELAAEVDDRETGEAARRFRDAAEAPAEVNDREIAAAARLYPALKRIFERHRLTAATLRCFDLLGRLRTTGCLALSLLNDEGRISGCEGDVAALFSMLLVHRLTAAIPFMANPARIDAAAGEVTLAHCTVAGRATLGYRIRSHFESGIGVGVAGRLATGPATLFKVGGPDLGDHFVAAGELLETRGDEEMCRTQARLRLDHRSVGYFFQAPLANHHVLALGDHSLQLRQFLAWAG